MLRKSVYPKIESTLNSWAAFLNNQGISPNQLTLGGLVLNLVAGCIFASGHFFLAGFMIIIAALGDMLDGPLARSTNRATKFGAFLDSTVDRYSDFFLFGGLCLYYAKMDQGFLLILSLLTLAGSFVTSYSKARAENLIDSCSAGIFERAERVITLALCALIWPLMPLGLFVLALGTNFTAIQRILFTRKVLSQDTDK